MNRATHDQVSNIFKLISDKETSKLGLKQLYDFKEKHPEVDIQPFLRGASPYFQSFINDGLAELQQSSQNNTNNNADTGANNENHDVRNQADGNPNNPDYWMKKLSMYRVRGKLQNDEKETMDNKAADDNLNMNQIQSRLTTMTRKDVSWQQFQESSKIFNRFSLINRLITFPHSVCHFSSRSWRSTSRISKF
jgi:cytoskeleton-associated protein 5